MIWQLLVNYRSMSSMTSKVACFHFCVAVLSISAASIVSGCASVVRGSSEKLVIQTVPSGAEVKLSTGQSGVTPWETQVKRKDTIMVTITKSGYKEVNTALISSIDGASLGIGTAANLLFLPVINDIVDYNTGANYSHKPNPLIVNLIPVTSSENYQYAAPTAASATPNQGGSAKAETK